MLCLKWTLQVQSWFLLNYSQKVFTDVVGRVGCFGHSLIVAFQILQLAAEARRGSRHLRHFGSLKNSRNKKKACRANTLCVYLCEFSCLKASVLRDTTFTHRECMLHVCMVCGCCQEMDPFLSSPWGVNLRALATVVVVSHTLKIGFVCVCACACAVDH